MEFPSEKPLPPLPPSVQQKTPTSKPLSSKPLPSVPVSVQAQPNYRTAFLIVSGLFVWFLAIVVMLPIIMEREAMIGLNNVLRKVFVMGKDDL